VKYLHLKLFRISVVAAMCLLSAAEASAGSIGYSITLNTSAVAGSQGFLDVQFNPGVNSSQAATAILAVFTTDGSFPGAAPSVFGPVSGTLPGDLFIDNSAYNDYFQSFTFGEAIHFYLNFVGPAVDSPDGTSSGSTFGFGLWDSTGGIPLLTTDPLGFVASVDLNNDGSLTPHSFPPSLDGGTPVAEFGAVPEPGTWLLAASALAFIAMKRRRG
jgi:hypothetical protein